MGLEQNLKGMDMYKDKPLKPRLHQQLLLILAIVGTNVIALYTFSSYCSGFHRPHRGSDGLHSALFGMSNAETLVAYLNASRADLQHALMELRRVRMDLQELRDQSERLVKQVDDVAKGVPERMRLQETLDQIASLEENDPWLNFARGGFGEELQEYINRHKLPLGWNPSLNTDFIVAPIGHACALHRVDINQYMDYVVGEECPDDEALAQKLTLAGCEPLPRRRCFSRSPVMYTDPHPFPNSMWELPKDENILWTAHPCKSFECLNERANKRVFADCLDCFDLDGREKHRWVLSVNELDFLIEDVVRMKSGTLRIGLDIGGGTGSFAARMREHNVTIITSTLNLGGPFNNFIAHRGLLPMYMTISERLPFIDNSLDIVHSMHVLSNWIPTITLEFLLYDIDRVLRPGGVFWLDHFFCIEPQLETYVPMIEKLGYTKLNWVVGAKLDRGPSMKEMYISALLEKPRGPRVTHQ